MSYSSFLYSALQWQFLLSGKHVKQTESDCRLFCCVSETLWWPRCILLTSLPRRLLFLTWGGNDTDFLLKGKSERESNLRVFPLLLMHYCQKHVHNWNHLWISFFHLLLFFSCTCVWAILALSMLEWQLPLNSRTSECPKGTYSSAAASSWGIFAALHKICDDPGAQKWMSNQSYGRSVCVETGLSHGGEEEAQQTRTSGPAEWCILSANKHPRQAATRWMTCYQSNTPWQTSGQLQLTITARKACHCLFNHLYLV